MARAPLRQAFSYLAYQITRGVDYKLRAPCIISRTFSSTRWAKFTCPPNDWKRAGVFEKRYYSHVPDRTKQHPVPTPDSSARREEAENGKPEEPWPEEPRPVKPDSDEILIRLRLGALWSTDNGVNFDVPRFSMMPKIIVKICSRLPKWAQDLVTTGKLIAIQKAFDSSFDPEDFMEGARYAFMRVNHLLSHRDIASMRDMVVPAVHDAYENAWAFYRARGYSVTFKVESLSEAHVHDVLMSNRLALGVPDWHPATAQAEQGDPAGLPNQTPSVEKEQPSSDTEASPRSGDLGHCLVVAVSYRALERLVISSPEGKVIIDETFPRPRTWHFARALPRHRRQAKALDSPWFVAGVQLPF